MEQDIFIKEDYIRLDSALKLAGLVATGGQAKWWIQEGRVKVNGDVCLMRGKKLREADVILFDENKVRICHAD